MKNLYAMLITTFGITAAASIIGGVMGEEAVNSFLYFIKESEKEENSKNENIK